MTSFLSLWLACQESSTKEPSINFNDLPEDQKRLVENAPHSFHLAPQTHLQTFASEPMMINPTNLDIDERGRVWICEAQNYRGFRNDSPQRAEGDRILIMEDTDGDGAADKEKVYYQGLDVNSALGIAKLGNKVYIAASPNVLVFTDTNGDDIPDHKDTLFTGLEGVDHDHGVHAIVFGPEGKLYFNFGNAGERLRLKSGELAVNRQGEKVEEGKTFRQGMIFRCNADGSDLEVLGHNFRNNYEVAVDPFGALWQSDNDDDGNQGTRINYVMEFGNYGFKDQVTGAGWRTPRIGMHEEIPKRHWYLNDPGIVPNLLQTGAGSPTGILVYEGSQLPPPFQHQMIHCEPGKNIVRAYPVKNDGAGYTAEILPLVESTDDWFRPSDVCTAPDGSIMIADWYDPGVGGHRMGDIHRGRVYRVHGTGYEKYDRTPADLGTPADAARNLNHPNQATRFLAYQKVAEAGQEGLNALESLISAGDTDVRLKGRIYWALASIGDNIEEIATRAIGEKDADLRMVGLRIARQFLPSERILAINALAIQDANPQVLREAAISLRFISGAEANQQWVTLAQKHTSADRWYLEALGIGADLHADERMSAYLDALSKRDLPGSKDIIWRSRSDLSLPLLYQYIEESKTEEEMVRYFRAMHFLTPSKTQDYLSKALSESNHPLHTAMTRYALASLSPEVLRKNRNIKRQVAAVIPEIRGTDMWTLVTKNGNLKSEVPFMLDSALASKDQSFRNEASNIVANIGNHGLIVEAFRKAAPSQKPNVIDLAANLKSSENLKWLFSLLEDPKNPVLIRREAAKALSKDWNGMEMLMQQLEENKFEGAEAEAIAIFLTQCSRSEIRQKAITWLAAKKGATPLDLNAMAEKNGDVAMGEAVFDKYCITCHQVADRGINFGPNLSLIGDKMGKGELLSAIVYPSQGVGFGYEGYNIETSDGTKYAGFIESETELELTLRMMGGISKIFALKDIAKREPMEESLMTANLHQLLDESELTNLVSYLSSLRQEENNPVD